MFLKYDPINIFVTEPTHFSCRDSATKSKYGLMICFCSQDTQICVTMYRSFSFSPKNCVTFQTGLKMFSLYTNVIPFSRGGKNKLYNVVKIAHIHRIKAIKVKTSWSTTKRAFSTITLCTISSRHLQTSRLQRDGTAHLSRWGLHSNFLT